MCKALRTFSFSISFPCVVVGIMFARWHNVLTTAALCCSGLCESKGKYFSVSVDFRWTATTTLPLGETVVCVSKMEMLMPSSETTIELPTVSYYIYIYIYIYIYVIYKFIFINESCKPFKSVFSKS